MKRTIKIIIVILIAILIFLGGYFTGINNREALGEIRIGYQNSVNPNEIDYPTIFTDTKNPTIVHNFIMIYLQKEKIEKMENVVIDVENPDIFILVLNPKLSVGLIDSRVWFTNEGAIIAERSGESWDQVEYFKIDEMDTNYIKEMIDYKEG
ncbi:hypothetical protein R4Z10_09290 [Niallia sp. XMNu-256]|uniref:hypothetical protein n=1 Tax=Niallia sp. XMNu-256 TaxID=3082444 RepID=UPI0030D48010